MTSQRNNPRWDTSRIQSARRVELKPLLEKRGFRLQALTEGNWRVYDLPKEILIKQHYWSCPEDGTGGNAIDLLTQVIGISFNEAMHWLEESAGPPTS